MMRYNYAIAIIFVLLLSGCAIINETQPIQSTPVKAVPKESAPEPVVKSVEKKSVAPESEEESEMDFEEGETKAIAAVKKFVTGLDGYKNQNGRDFQVLNSVKSGCEGCWIVEVRFTRDLLYYPDKTEHIKVNVKLKDWKMDSYTFG